jgi:hypothetical protein
MDGVVAARQVALYADTIRARGRLGDLIEEQLICFVQFSPKTLIDDIDEA